jgi:bifunctional non-homologous end joining protein LigD
VVDLNPRTAALDWPILPMKAVAGDLPTGPKWVHEPKWDGHRALVRTGPGSWAAASSRGHDRTTSWPWLAEAVAGLPDAVLDGEVIALDDAGRPAFQRVGRSDAPHAFVLFDVLVIGTQPLVDSPWTERRAALESIVEPGAALIVTPVTDDRDAMWEATHAGGFEGVVSKRVDSIYRPGHRSPAWVKSKHRAQQEFVVGGVLAGTGHRQRSFGSLLLGAHRDGRLEFVGAVGTGFDAVTLETLRSALARLETDVSPFDPRPTIPPRVAVAWVRPELVVQVAFTGWTDAGRLRHPVFLGVRDDVRAEDVGFDP